jgi:hypothetical protein
VAARRARPVSGVEFLHFRTNKHANKVENKEHAAPGEGHTPSPRFPPRHRSRIDTKNDNPINDYRKRLIGNEKPRGPRVSHISYLLIRDWLGIEFEIKTELAKGRMTTQAAATAPQPPRVALIHSASLVLPAFSA